MTKKSIGRLAFRVLVCLAMTVICARANNLQVTNVSVSGRDDTTAYVQFDISWANSWRHTNINHDAAWVFFKVLPLGSNAWQHVTLEGTGINPTGYAPGSGTGIELIVPADRRGLFVRRAGDGEGPVSVQRVKAVWNYASNSLVSTDKVRLQALALEMVYVAEGSYKLGSGGTGANEFREGGGGSSPFTVTNAGSIACSNLAGCLYAVGNLVAGTISSNFPNGYNAFYCMKYEITEGQWVDFFNTLSDSQKLARDITGASGKNSDAVVTRNTVAWDHTNPGSDATSTRRDRVCNYVSWADGCAFTDWAGLRPLTELEYEKACRGPLDPVADEYAWGTATIMASSIQGLSVTEDGTEIVTNSTALGGCNYGGDNHAGGDGGQGPLRAGIFATNGASRVAAGASYWGILELSGNQWERVVTVSQAAGFLFTGLHGNGVLTTADGEADVSNWPGSGAGGSGSRGGSYNSGMTSYRVSDRGDLGARALRYPHYGGWRAVRTAPPGVGP